jgi:nicotinamide-nucleotide amidase
MAVDDGTLEALSARVGQTLKGAGWRLVTAESCTGGWLAKCLTDVPGSSQWFERGYVTYSDAAKEQALGVSAEVIATFGAVSRPTAEQMAAGALHASGADLAIAVTGIAGPDGGSADKPVGLVWFALARRGAGSRAQEHRFAGDRAAVRRAAVMTALGLVAAEVPGHG